MGGYGLNCGFVVSFRSSICGPGWPGRRRRPGLARARSAQLPTNPVRVFPVETPDDALQFREDVDIPRGNKDRRLGSSGQRLVLVVIHQDAKARQVETFDQHPDDRNGSKPARPQVFHDLPLSRSAQTGVQYIN